jgi:hypothetical protein
MKTAVAVIVLGYRAGQELASGSLSSIVDAAQRIAGYDVRVVYLDNYSRDGSIEWIMSHHPEVDLLLAPTNELYCKGVNNLLRYTYHRYRPKFFILVDADNPAELAAYANLVRFADEHPEAGLVQPLIKELGQDGIYSCGHTYTDDHWCRPRKHLPEDACELWRLPSCSISSTLVRTEVFERCGLLDTLYEIYYESADLSFRARREQFTCACEVRAITYNRGTAVIGPGSMHHGFYFNRNRILFWRIHDPEIYRDVAAEARAKLAELEAELDRRPFGLDAQHESIRRGLTDGLRLAEDPALYPRRPLDIRAFAKTDAVLLQEGRIIETSGV